MVLMSRIVLGLLIALLITVITKNIHTNITSTLVKEEWIDEKIQIIYLKPPTNYKFSFIRMRDMQEIHYTGKHCNAFDDAYFVVGAVYRVKMHYSTYKLKDGRMVTYREDTNGCDLIGQFPLKEVKYE